MNIEKNKGLARYTTYQIGGAADYFLEASSKDELLAGLEWAKNEEVPVFVFGGGSNLLFDDAGFRGLVIRVADERIRVSGDEIVAGAGVKIAGLVNAAKSASLTGLEGWNGLPGTVGGAVFGNAGCFGVESKDVLVAAEIYDGSVRSVGVDFFEYEYRNSKLKRMGGVVVLSATFKLRHGEASEIEAKMKETAISRVKKQPAGSSTGSFFKNTSAGAAGMLIEQCGLKGKMLGRAQVSEYHANFLLNKGGAKSADILALADLIKSEVKAKFGIELEREVVYVPPAGNKNI